MLRTTTLWKVLLIGLLLPMLSPVREASAGINEWTSNGPEGGSIYALAIDPQTPTTLYAGTLGGGIFKSTNGGATWSAANTGLTASTAVYALVVDPQTPTTLYAGTSGGVFKSTNGGMSWSAVNTGLMDTYVRALAVDSQTPAVLYAGTSGGVFKSTNGGTTWSAVNVGLTASTAVYALVVDPQTPAVLYAGTSGGVFKTLDGGGTWSAARTGLTAGTVSALTIDPQTPSTLFAGTGYGGGVFKSVDGGVTWSAVNTGLPAIWVYALAVDPQTPATLYAGTWGGDGIFKSVDGGANWSAVSTGMTANRVLALAIDPQTPATLYAGTNGGGMFKSANGGATWSTINTGLTVSNVYALAVDPQTPATLYAGTSGGGVFKSTDGSASWSAANIGLTDTYVNALAVDPQTPATLYAGTDYGGVFKSTDGSASWSAANIGLTDTYVNALAVDPQTPTTLYAGTRPEYDGGVFKSVNGGASWSAANTGLTDTYVNALAVDPQTPNTLYAGTLGGRVFKSMNGGATWSAINTGLPADISVSALAVDSQTPSTLYAGTDYGGVFKSTNGGATWSAINTGLTHTNVRALAVDSQTPTTLYAGTYGGGVFKSTDGGATWRAFNTGLTNSSVYTLAVDPQSPTTLYAGTYGGGVFTMQQVVAPAAPTLNPITNSAGHSSYTVSWSSVSGATSYTLQQAANSEFTNAAAAYTGSATQYTVSNQPGGTYYYRVRASNAAGDSDWSNTQSVMVTGSVEGDTYEPDNTCAQARVIPTDGTVQRRTLHKQADEDWVVFTATAGVEYRIEAQIPPGSPADVTLEVYGQCAGLPLESQNYAFTPGVRLHFTAPTSGPLYLRWTNSEATVYGAEVAYHVSARALATEPTPGALVILAGKLRANDPLQSNIHRAANQVYQLFTAQGYDPARIYYLATDLSLPGVNALATTANLQAALTSWAVDKVGPERALTLYVVDHGLLNQIYLDKPAGQWVTPAQLDSWLTELESACPGVKVNVIIEACHAGSFIYLPQTVSRPGRVVIASTGAYNLAYASPHGAVFTDYFASALGQDESLYAAFQTARWATRAGRPMQTPWLDDNGNGVPNEAQDGDEAALRGFVYAGTLTGDQWPPYIAAATGPGAITQGRGVIGAEVRDDEQVKRVWAVIYPPSYRLPESGEELVSEVLPTIVLQAQGSDQFAATYTGFDELGVYRVVIYAEDDGGREARPVSIEVRTGWGVFLPLVVRR